MKAQLAFLILIVAAPLVRADDFIVYSPHVIATQSEAELRGYAYTDPRADHGGNAAELSLAHAFTDWWKPEVYVAKYQQDAGARGGFQGYEFENTFQLTQPGQYGADFGLLASYERRAMTSQPDALEFGPLIEATYGRFAQILNLIVEKSIGGGAGNHTEFRYSYSGTYALSKSLRPGLEFYGRPSDHAYQIGPIVSGEWRLANTTGSLEYRVGVVLGINADAPRQAWLARLEYEFF